MTRHRIILIRHGETDWNAEARLQGQQDIPLNARGLAQAEAVGRKLRNLLGDGTDAGAGLHWVSSPLGRARHTMDIARRVAGLDSGPDQPGYSLDDRLMELTFGEWEGLTWPEVQARAPWAASWREGDKWNFVPPGGESYQMLADRVRPWVEKLASDAVVATHGGVARVLLAELAGMARERAATVNIWQGRLLVLDNGRFDWI